MAAPAAGSITLNDLLALNDEIRALARAGVPLEKGLRSIGQDQSGRLSRLAASLGARLERGESLVDALDESVEGFPRAYHAVVAAGVRSGRLAAALEGISTAVRRASELRQVMIIALVYPIVVLAVASAVFLFTALKIVPVMTRVYGLMEVEQPWWQQQLGRVVEISPQLLLVFWAVGLVAGVFWLYGSNRAKALSAARFSGFPTVARVLQFGRLATFADVLALMVEQQVPLDEAVELSAEASGDRGLAKASQTLAERIRSGDQTITLPREFPPLLAWLICGGANQTQLTKNLRRTAESYRRRALHMGNWLTLYLPIVLSAGVGGSIALFYVLVVMAPFYHLLYQLSLP